jgi:hypothetical protein
MSQELGAAPELDPVEPAALPIPVDVEPPMPLLAVPSEPLDAETLLPAVAAPPLPLGDASRTVPVHEKAATDVHARTENTPTPRRPLVVG